MVGYSNIIGNLFGGALSETEGYSSVVNSPGSTQAFGAPVTGRRAPNTSVEKEVDKYVEKYSEYPTIPVLPPGGNGGRGSGQRGSGTAAGRQRSKYDQVLPHHVPGGDGWKDYSGGYLNAPESGSPPGPKVPLTSPPPEPADAEQDPDAEPAPSSVDDIVALVANLLEVKERISNQRVTPRSNESLRQVREWSARALNAAGVEARQQVLRQRFAKLAEGLDKQRKEALAQTDIGNLGLLATASLMYRDDAMVEQMLSWTLGTAADPIGSMSSMLRTITDNIVRQMRAGATYPEAVDLTINPVSHVLQARARSEELASDAADALRRGNRRLARQLAIEAGAEAGNAAITAGTTVADSVGFAVAAKGTADRWASSRAARNQAGGGREQGAAPAQHEPAQPTPPREEEVFYGPDDWKAPQRQTMPRPIDFHDPLTVWPSTNAPVDPRLKVFPENALQMAQELAADELVRRRQVAAYRTEQIHPRDRVKSRLWLAGPARQIKEYAAAVREALIHPGQPVLTQVRMKELRVPGTGQRWTVEEILASKGLLRKRKKGPPRARTSTIPDIAPIDSNGILNLHEVKEPTAILDALGFDVETGTFRNPPWAPGLDPASELAMQTAERQALLDFASSKPGSEWVMNVGELDGTRIMDFTWPADKVRAQSVGPYELPRRQ